MSTSISITISEEHDTKNSRSFSDLRKPGTADCNHLKSNDAFREDQLYERRHTGLGIGSANHEHTFFETGSSKLKRWRHHNNPEPRTVTGYDSEVDDFYAEVDDKMSRNSYEYPEQQAKYIESWLTTAAGRSKSFDSNSMRLNGNIVGIRGFSSESLLADDKQHKADYQKLRREYLKLEADYNRLRSRLTDANRHHTQSCRRKDFDLNALRAIVMKQERQLESIFAGKHHATPGVCDRCRRMSTVGGVDDEFEQIRFAKNQLGLKLAHQEQEHGAILENMRKESERLKSVIHERDKELQDLRNQVKNLSLEPNNRKLLALSSENARLRDADDIDRQEYVALRENYQRLEMRLRSLIEDQKSLNEEQNDEIKEVLLELCKLQVYQPKLEMILETESQTRLHLQSQLSALREEKENLVDQMESLNRELNEARIQALSRDSTERLREELLLWQEKFHRLKKEYSDLEDLQRATKSRVSRQDARAQNEIQMIRESSLQELERAKDEQRQLETRIASLEVDLSRVTNQLDRCKSERDRANKELLLLHQRLEEVSNSRPNDQKQIESITNKLKQSEQMISTLQQELSVSVLNYKNLTAKLEMAHGKLEHSKHQYDELKRSFDLQQKAFAEMKEKKDKEVSKLRLDLNLEQYNRQVSLKGIEKELRASLRELEAMKYRFSKRLSGPNESSVTTTTATTTNASTVGTNQTNARRQAIRFDEPSRQLAPTSRSTLEQTVEPARRQSEFAPAE